MTLIRFYKPFGVLSQFRDPARATLADYVNVPGVYPAGRLDRDSEGLLLLTDDGALQARIAHPRFRCPKFYWVQVEAMPTKAKVDELANVLRDGVALADGRLRAESLRLLSTPHLPPRDPPVTPHRAARSCWLEAVLSEGRNRQVRRMLAAVGLPVLRLHRARIGTLDLQGLEPGAWDAVEIPDIWRAVAGPHAPRGRIRRPRGRSSR